MRASEIPMEHGQPMREFEGTRERSSSGARASLGHGWVCVGTRRHSPTFVWQKGLCLGRACGGFRYFRIIK